MSHAAEEWSNNSTALPSLLHSSALLAVSGGGLVSNALVLLLFYRRPTLRSFSNRFVLNLSLCHLLQCLLPLPSSALMPPLPSYYYCPLSGALFLALNLTAVLSLLLIALDRNCAVNSPLRYSATVTKRRTGGLCLLTWLVGAGAAAPPAFGVGGASIEYSPEWRMCALRWWGWPWGAAYAGALLLFGFCLPFVTTCCVYASMFRAARDNSERARKHSVNSVDSPRRWSTGSNQFFGEEWKAVRTGVLVVSSFALCWLPYFSAMALESLFGPPAVPFLPFCVLFSSSSCLVDPYLYVFRNKNSRKMVKQLLCPSSSDRQKPWMRPPCVLTASLEGGAEKVKALPAVEGQWQVFSSSREELDDEENKNSSDVRAIYNASYSKQLEPRLLRLKTSSSSDTCSMSLESNEEAPPSRRGIGRYLFNTSEELWESSSQRPLSSFGSARRKSFIRSHRQHSNETTLTSSANSVDATK